MQVELKISKDTFLIIPSRYLFWIRFSNGEIHETEAASMFEVMSILHNAGYRIDNVSAIIRK